MKYKLLIFSLLLILNIGCTNDDPDLRTFLIKNEFNSTITKAVVSITNTVYTKEADVNIPANNETSVTWDIAGYDITGDTGFTITLYTNELSVNKTFGYLGYGTANAEYSIVLSNAGEITVTETTAQ